MGHLDERILCPSCCKTFQRPVELTCGHVLCQGCVRIGGHGATAAVAAAAAAAGTSATSLSLNHSVQSLGERQPGLSDTYALHLAVCSVCVLLLLPLFISRR